MKGASNMKIEKLPAQVQVIVDGNHSMSSYLANLSVGRKETPHSWLYENEKSEETLARWIPIMEKALKSAPLGEEFIQFDRRQLSKFGPQGAVPPISSPQAMEVIEPLFSPSEYDDEMALSVWFPRTKEFAQILFGARLMTDRPLSFNETVDDMRARDTLTTNSGFPWFTTRSKIWELAAKRAASGDAYDDPALILFRFYNGKLRPVWMYPMAMNLLELRFENVIKRKIRSSPTQWVREYVSPWVGYDEVKRTLTKQWPKPAPIVGGDTTAMDAHMRKAQMRLFFEIVKWLFQRQYWDELWKAIERCNTIPLVIGPTTWITGDHGLASGAGFTQISETVLQLFMAWINGCIGQGIGDDFSWLVEMTDEEVVSYLAKFGLPANAQKQEVGTVKASFLQRMNHQGFFSREDPSVLGGYYPTIRALNSSLNPEKFHKPKDWSKDMFAIRQFMILENTVDDPEFDEFLKFVVNGHPYLREFAKKSASDLQRIQNKARLIPGLNPTYTQEKRDKPLSSFVSIQLAKKM